MYGAWYLKLAQTWANLTTSEAAKASETRYQATSAKIAADQIDRAQKKAREGKPEVRLPSDKGPLFGD